MLFRLMFFLALGACLYGGFKSEPVPQVVYNFDLILHFGAFGLLAVLWVLGFVNGSASPRMRFWAGLVLLILLGICIELYQGYLLPARTADWWDMAANSAGVLLGGIAGCLLLWLKPRLLPVQK